MKNRTRHSSSLTAVELCKARKEIKKGDAECKKTRFQLPFESQ